MDERDAIAENLRIVTRRAAPTAKAISAIIARTDIPGEEAVEFIDLYPEWQPDKRYYAGTVLQHEGNLYRVAQKHVSSEEHPPGCSDQSLYTPIHVDPETGYDEWQQPTGAHDAYSEGTIVLDASDGNLYRSKVDGNTWGPPHQYPSLWELYEGTATQQEE